MQHILTLIEHCLLLTKPRACVKMLSGICDTYDTSLTFMSCYDNLLACRIIVIDTCYDWQLAYYELVMNYYDLQMTLKYFRENPMYRR